MKRQIFQWAAEMRKIVLYHINKHPDCDHKTQTFGIVIRSGFAAHINDYVIEEWLRYFIFVCIQNQAVHAEDQDFYMEADCSPSFPPEIGMVLKECFLFQQRHNMGNIIERLPFIPPIKHREKGGMDGPPDY
jgi:hypothetical protein